MLSVGDSPSGKALGSGPSIRGFESLIPSHILSMEPLRKNAFLQKCVVAFFVKKGCAFLKALV